MPASLPRRALYWQPMMILQAPRTSCGLLGMKPGSLAWVNLLNTEPLLPDLIPRVVFPVRWPYQLVIGPSIPVRSSAGVTNSSTTAAETGNPSHWPTTAKASHFPVKRTATLATVVPSTPFTRTGTSTKKPGRSTTWAVPGIPGPAWRSPNNRSNKPLALATPGQITFTGGITAYGVYYAATASAVDDLTLTGGGSATIVGSLVSRGDFARTGNGNISIIYNSNLFGGKGPPTGILAPVPGSWRDKDTAF